MDIEQLKDYLIADEIARIQSLTREELVSELIEFKTRCIETGTPSLLNHKNYAKENYGDY